MDNMENVKFIFAILGAVISVPYDLSLFFPLIQYQRQKIRAEQIPTRMYLSFLITSTIVSARNVIFVDKKNDRNFFMFVTVASVSLTITFTSTMWLFWIKFRNRNCKTQFLILSSLLITNLLLMIDVLIIVWVLNSHPNSIGIMVFQIVTTIVILINTIVPFPFDNFTQCDYKKVPLVTVITGIFDNIGWIVITFTKFDSEQDNTPKIIMGTLNNEETFGFVANGGSLLLNIVHVLFYIYWKYKNDKKIDYTIVTEIK